MAHLTEGTLRRLYDEPDASAAAVREHYDACSQCQRRFEAIAGDARQAASWLMAPDISIDVRPAFAALQDRIRRDESTHPVRRYERWLAVAQLRWPGVARPLTAAVVVAVLLAVVGVSGVAQNVFTIFEPRQLVTVSVSPSDLQGVPDLTAYGTLKWTPSQPELRPTSDAAAAAAESGLPVLTPSALPTGLPRSVNYAVVSRATASFTFSAAKAREAAAKAGKSLPPMPANMDGSTLYVTAGPALLEIYGGLPSGATGGDTLPALVIFQARAPQVTSTGVTAKELQDYLLAQPGISPQLQAQIRAIGDPTHTLPIPLPAGQATSRSIQVGGGQGIFIGDSTGLASAVIWQRDGIVYAVGGTLTESQAVMIANSLR